MDCAVWCGGARAVRACLHRSLPCGRCQAVTAWAAPAGPGSARDMRSSRRRSRAGRPADRRRRPARELRRCRRAWQPCAAGAGGLAAALARLQAMGVANGRPWSHRMGGGCTGAAWNRAEMRRTADAGANTPGAFARLWGATCGRRNQPMNAEGLRSPPVPGCRPGWWAPWGGVGSGILEWDVPQQREV